MAVQPETLLSK